MSKIQEREQKWQKRWIDEKAFQAQEDSSKKKYYVLDMFPYPSGDGLHVGHVEGYTATDIVARYKRMQGYNVLHPMGWDSFGLPAENHALKTGIHPEISTKKNIANFKRQLQSIGFSYDWSREIATSDPSYYKWTQWIFLKLYEQGLAYEAEMVVNWCPALKTVLANEEVIDGKSEVGGHEVIQKPMKQWVLKITDYAEALLQDLDELDWPSSVKEMQRQWIGKSEGALIDFFFGKEKFSVYTTRPETLFGVEAIVFSPEHEFLKKINLSEEAKNYQEITRRKTYLERQSKEKTAVKLNIEVSHPYLSKKIPVYIADYVLPHYGTGIVMCVPAHDERDFELAKKLNLTVTKVIESSEPCYTESGTMINASFLTGLFSEEAKEILIKKLEEEKLGIRKVSYKLRDWLFSRQRYWGEPFPLIKLSDGKVIPLKEEDLPLILPEVDKIELSETGESPLANIQDWVKISYQGEKAYRETHTMPQWAGSCWYYLRFLDPTNNDSAFDPKKEQYWMPVDLYIGGMEHAVLHLLYARFWHKVLYKLGLVSTKEPFKKLFNQGLILGPDGEKMSKSRGNVVNPDELIQNVGADALRLFEMFLGPLEKAKPWNPQAIKGISSFLKRVEEFQPTKDSTLSLKILHQSIKKVTQDVEELKFNTAISQMMICLNTAEKEGLSPESFIQFLKLLAPFAPHLAEERYAEFSTNFISLSSWPSYNEELAKEEEVTIAFQLQGKTKHTVTIPIDASLEEVKKILEQDEKSQKLLMNKIIIKEIFVPNKIINFILKQD